MGYVYLSASNKLSQWGLRNDLGTSLVKVSYSKIPPVAYEKIINHDEVGGYDDWIILGKFKIKAEKKNLSIAFKKHAELITEDKRNSKIDMIFRMGKSNFINLLNHKDSAAKEMINSILQE